MGPGGGGGGGRQNIYPFDFLGIFVPVMGLDVAHGTLSSDSG